MSRNAPNAESRENKIFGLLLRRLSTGANLTNVQNTQRDQIYALVVEKDYEQALQINQQLLNETSGMVAPADNSSLVYSFFEKLFKRASEQPSQSDQTPDQDEGNTDQKIAMLALDRAVLLGLSGQPAEASMLLEHVMNAQIATDNITFTEEIFEVASELADLAGDRLGKQNVSQARIQYYFELALASGNQTHLDTALQSLEINSAEIYQTDDPQSVIEHVRIEAGLLRDFGIAHEQTELIRRSSTMLEKAAQNARQSGDLNRSYTLELERYAVDIELAKLMTDPAELQAISNRLRDFIELPDTMLGPEGRADARHLLGYCLTRSADIDGKVITLRKAFGYLEGAAKSFAEQGLESKELRSLKDLALAKVTAAEILALNGSNGDTDLVLAQRYKAEALQLQEQLSTRLANS